MPQLNPGPWFSTMLITWLTLLFMMTKLTTLTVVTPPKGQNYTTTKIQWTWPWQ